ncbi:hypothetical protein D3C80_1220140 [compost metagenome]
MRGQPALQAQALAQADLAEQGVVENLVGQAAGQQALGGLVPVQGDQLTKASGLFRVVEKGRFLQLQLTGFAVQQADAAEGELFLADVQVRQADRAVDHPVRRRPCRHDAQLVGRAGVAGTVAAEGAGAVGDVTRQGVMAGGFIVAGVVAVVP